MTNYGDGQTTSMAEDKKCRICGFADQKNVNIFSSPDCRTLLTKIVTVYPIILYQNDPLPKNICKKCIYNVTLMYTDIQRVMKTQSKWIQNVRAVQPNHNYIRMLDLIEHTTTVTRESIKFTLGEDINEHGVNRFMLLNMAADENVAKETNGAKKKITALRQQSETETETESIGPSSKNKIKNLKSILELNGCSLVAVGGKPNKPESSYVENVNESTESQTATLKDEPNKHDDDAVDLSTSTETVADYEQDTSQILPLIVKCRYCPLNFLSLVALAKHQLIHVRVEIPKIFQLKYLPKSVRRGRLITVQSHKCIRCLNCWRVFVDNKSILEHWSIGECAFYCNICGKEFAQSPRMLREHVPAAHGISYRASKVQRVHVSIKPSSSTECNDKKSKPKSDVKDPVVLNFEVEEISFSSAQTKTNRTAHTPSSTSTSSSKKHSNQIKHDDGTVSCHLCFKSFQNFKARNSHMRKHKPSFVFGDLVMPPSHSESDAYMQNETATTTTTTTNSDYERTIKLEPSEFINVEEKHTNVVILNPSSGPTPKTFATSSAIRGVRTKFVSRRSDLNTNHAIKVKSMHDLQYTPTTPTAPTITTEHKVIAAKTWVMPEAIKTEPADSETYSTAVITCEHCAELFGNNSDYNLHKIQMHSNICCI